MRNFLAVGAMAIGLAGLGHNMPPAPLPTPYHEQMEAANRIKRAKNK